MKKELEAPGKVAQKIIHDGAVTELSGNSGASTVANLAKNVRRQYNAVCRGYVHECKQSFQAILIACPHYLSKRSKCYDRRGSKTGL